MSYPASGSAFDRIEQRFQALTTMSTRPLTVSGFEIGHGLPDRVLPLHELRDLVARPGAATDLKDAVWSVLVRRARRDSDTWGVAAAGVMIRGLRRIAFKVSNGVEFHRHDLISEILLGFFEALATVDPDARRLYSLLWWAA